MNKLSQAHNMSFSATPSINNFAKTAKNRKITKYRACKIPQCLFTCALYNQGFAKSFSFYIITSIKGELEGQKAPKGEIREMAHLHREE